jgi:hypothetical protein
MKGGQGTDAGIPRDSENGVLPTAPLRAIGSPAERAACPPTPNSPVPTTDRNVLYQMIILPAVFFRIGVTH